MYSERENSILEEEISALICAQKQLVSITGFINNTVSLGRLPFLKMLIEVKPVEFKKSIYQYILTYEPEVGVYITEFAYDFFCDCTIKIIGMPIFIPFSAISYIYFHSNELVLYLKEGRSYKMFLNRRGSIYLITDPQYKFNYKYVTDELKRLSVALEEMRC